MKKYLNIICVLLLATACDFPQHYFSPAPACNSTSSDTEQQQTSTAQQQRLRDKIRSAKASDFRYFFKTFLEEAGQTYMLTNFRNQTDCFDIKILVNKWDKLKGMHRTNGYAYPKELYDLKWQIQSIGGQEEVVYLDMHDIID